MEAEALSTYLRQFNPVNHAAYQAAKFAREVLWSQQQRFLVIQKAIFQDLAWQHELFADGGHRAFELMQARLDPSIAPEILAIWRPIGEGEILDGNWQWVPREQNTVIQKYWNEFTEEEGIAIGVAAVSPLPDGIPFMLVSGNRSRPHPCPVPVTPPTTHREQGRSAGIDARPARGARGAAAGSARGRRGAGGDRRAAPQPPRREGPPHRGAPATHRLAGEGLLQLLQAAVERHHQARQTGRQETPRRQARRLGLLPPAPALHARRGRPRRAPRRPTRPGPL